MNQYYTVRQTDVDKSILHLWNEDWAVGWFASSGMIKSYDVGKRLYLIPDSQGGFILMETEAGKRAREARLPRKVSLDHGRQTNRR